MTDFDAKQLEALAGKLTQQCVPGSNSLLPTYSADLEQAAAALREYASRVHLYGHKPDPLTLALRERNAERDARLTLEKAYREELERAEKAEAVLRGDSDVFAKSAPISESNLNNHRIPQESMETGRGDSE